MRIQIPDNLADRASVIGARVGRPLEDIIRMQLSKWGDLDPTRRYVILDAEALEEIEKKLGGGITSHVILLEKFRQLAGVSFMGRDIRLSIGQLQELAHRVHRTGKPIEVILEDIWRRLVDEFFNVGGGGEAIVPVGETAPWEGSRVPDAKA